MSDQIIFKVHEDLFKLGTIQETKKNQIKIETVTGTTQWLPQRDVYSINSIANKTNEPNIFKKYTLKKLIDMFGSNENNKGLQGNSITTYKGTVNKILREENYDTLTLQKLEEIKNLYNETAINKFYTFIENLDLFEEHEDSEYQDTEDNNDEDNDDILENDYDNTEEEDTMQKKKYQNMKRKSIIKPQEQQRIYKKRYSPEPIDIGDHLISKPCGFLYVVQEKRHENTNIYKIGRTIDLYQRLKGYPEGKLIHAMSVCLDVLEIKERLLKQLLSKRLEKKREGYEYFEGDRKVFLQAFSELEE